MVQHLIKFSIHANRCNGVNNYEPSNMQLAEIQGGKGE